MTPRNSTISNNRIGRTTDYVPGGIRVLSWGASIRAALRPCMVWVFVVGACSMWIGPVRAAATLWPGRPYAWGISASSLPLDDDVVVLSAAVTVRRAGALPDESVPAVVVRPLDEPSIGWHPYAGPPGTSAESTPSPTSAILEGPPLDVSRRYIDLLGLFTGSLPVGTDDPITAGPADIHGWSLEPAMLQWIDFMGSGAGFGLAVESHGGPMRLDGLALDLLTTPVDAPGTAALWRGELRLEDFSTPLSGWAVVDQGDRMGPSDWHRRGGVVVQTSNIHSGPVHPANLLKPGTYLRYDGARDWSDYHLACVVRSDSLNDFGLAFRMVDENNTYRFSWSARDHYSRLVRITAGSPDLLAWRNTGFEPGRAYRITITAHGSTLAVSVDGQPWLQADDDTFRTGTFALYSWAGAGGVQFDDLVAEHDLRPVAELTIDPNDPGNIRLVSAVGRTTRPTIPRRPGFTGLVDDFDQPDGADPIGWAVVDQGDRLGPSHWVVDQGRLTQTAGIYSEPTWPWALARPGTFIYYRRGMAWTDYEFTASVRGRRTGDYGVLFHLADPNNFYRVSWSPSLAAVRLVRMRRGAATLLASRSDPCPADQWRRVRVVVANAALTVAVDDQLYFNLVDHDIPSGTVGLYTWGTAADFDTVRVRPLP